MVIPFILVSKEFGPGGPGFELPPKGLCTQSKGGPLQAGLEYWSVGVMENRRSVIFLAALIPDADR
jgi:hypothetical protein